MEDKKNNLATFAGGCFWCLESAFRDMDGVVRVMSGYTGGTIPNPSYQDVCEGGTGHVEAIEIEFDPKVVEYETLLERYWLNVDPTDNGGQFVDRGSQYRTVIFVNSKEQREKAEESKRELGLDARFKKPIVTEIKNVSVFYPAEEYHQEYDRKFPGRYKLYVWGSGRQNGLEKLWGEGQVNPKMEISKIEEELKSEIGSKENDQDVDKEIINNEEEVNELGVKEKEGVGETEVKKDGLDAEEKVVDLQDTNITKEGNSEEKGKQVVRFGDGVRSNKGLDKEIDNKKLKDQRDEGKEVVESAGDEVKIKDDYKEKITKLNSMQYQVTQQCGTEPPFANEYWDEKRDGIYVDVVSGEVLFSSKDKYDSGTGWPSFSNLIAQENVIENQDDSGFVKRVEVKSSNSGSHLGHVFEDGPKEKGGRRYCVNSAALRFIPKEELENEGYGEWKDRC